MENVTSDQVTSTSIPTGECRQYGRMEWSKVLWREQPFPDNYVPDSFLAELRDLKPRPLPKLTALIISSLPITQHLCIIALFLAVFYGLLLGSLSPFQVGWGCAICAVTGRGIWLWGWGSGHRQRQRQGIWRGTNSTPLIPTSTPLRPLLLPPLILSLLSPILGTLTSATTSDTIWPLSAGLFVVHLLLADFGTGEDRRKRSARIRAMARARRMSVGASSAVGVKGELEDVEEKSLTSSLSLTCALSASIVLASRLPSTSHVFSLVLLAVLLFAGWPRIARGVRESGQRFSMLLTASLVLLSLSFFPTSPSLPSHVAFPVPLFIPSIPTIAFLSIIAIVNIGGPIMLRHAWRWKTRRGGGWDVARVRVRKGRDR